MHVQIRGIEDVSAVSVVGTIGMLLALAIAAIRLCTIPRPDTYMCVLLPSPLWLTAVRILSEPICEVVFPIYECHVAYVGLGVSAV